MVTRTQVAQYVANNIQSENVDKRDKAIQTAAKWLKKTGKTRQSEYLIRDITNELYKTGYVYVAITSAHKLNNETINSLKEYIKNLHDAKHIELNTKIDQDLIGGVKIETPVGILDTSIKARLAKIVEGVSV